MAKALKSKFLSRKFLMAVGTVAFAVLGWVTGQLEPQQAIKIIATIVGGYLGVEGLIDLKTAR